MATAATTSYNYDQTGRQYRTVFADGFETQVLFDGLGRIRQIYEAYGTADQRVVDRFYDAGGRLISQTTAPGQAEAVTLTWTYDGLGNVLSSTDGNGQSTVFSYDALGRILTRSVPISSGVSAVTTNTWNAFGDLVKVVDPRGNAGFFYHDSLGRQTLQVDPEGYATQTTYSRGGEVETVTRYAQMTSGTPTTSAPLDLRTGTGSPVIIDSST